MTRFVLPVLLVAATGVAAWLAWPGTDEGALRPELSDSLPQKPSSLEALPARPVPAWAQVSKEQVEAAAQHHVVVAFENRLGMRFVLVPGATFSMGSPPSEGGRRDDETQHTVSLTRPYYMQTTEVTNALIREYEPAYWTRYHGSGSFRGHALGGDRLPAVQVSWHAATSFATKVSNADPDRRTYTLPTEAQWEHACRARSTSPFWWGASWEEGSRCANSNDAKTRAWLRLAWRGWPQDDGHRLTAPVGSYRPNRWGLYDMAGNVWEWCADWYGPYPSGACVDPRGPRTGIARVLRGGSWLFDPSRVRSAARVRDGPSAFSINVGFRLVSPLPEKAD
jgi:sulfatase modifying factor 1